MRSVSLFLMAHQDDEYGVFQQIECEVSAGRWVRCVYVTDGAATASSYRRDQESRGVLQKLGVEADDILFVGRELSIGDGQLHHNVAAFADWLECFVNDHSNLYSCFVPAWEGGHPDHDLLHAIAIEVLAQQKISPAVWQYPLYNGRDCFGPFFRVMSPLKQNGPIQSRPIAWRDRFRYINFCLSYPSQWRSWLGLFPFVGCHYLCLGTQSLQHVNRARLDQPPHRGPLYYELRGFLDWPKMCLAIKELRKKYSA